MPTQTVISIISIPLAVWLLSLEGYGLSSPQSHLGLSHEEPVLIPLLAGSDARSQHCVSTPPFPLQVTAVWTRKNNPYCINLRNACLTMINIYSQVSKKDKGFLTDSTVLLMLRPTMAGSQANCMAFLVSLRLHCDMINRDV